MAGIQQTGSRRSAILDQLLRKNENFNRNIQSPEQLIAELGAAFANRQHAKRLEGEEAASQEQIAEAVRTGRATAPKNINFEQIGNEPGLAPMTLPGKRAIKSEQEDAINALPPEQQMQARSLQQAQRDANAPTAAQAATIAHDRATEADTIADERVTKREQAQVDAQARAAEKTRKFSQSDQEREFEQRDTEQIREITSKAALARLEAELVGGGMDLRERQGKATVWLSNGYTANKMIEDKLNSGYFPSDTEQTIYAKSIDEETGVVSQKFLRQKGLSQEATNFFDAAYPLIDGVIRQTTGAVVKPFEFINWTNTLIPFSNDPQENEQKSLIRARILEGFAAEAGPQGVAIFNQINEKHPVGNFGVVAGGDTDMIPVAPETQSALDKYKDLK